METTELFIRVEHPPHKIPPKRKGFLPAVLLKITLSILLFFLFSHFSSITPEIPNGQLSFQEWSGITDFFRILNPGAYKKERMIQEILAVLEKHQTGLANVTKEELAEVIYEESARYNHDPKFILALISMESSFQNWSVSEKGAKGLMQIMPYVAQSIAHEMGIEWGGDQTLFNPFLNIKIGIHYLSRLIDDFNDLGLALTAYNYGPTYVKDRIGKKQQVSLHFYNRVLSAYQTLSTPQSLPLGT
jgi:soluble lytic murein transglycosylase